MPRNPQSRRDLLPGPPPVRPPTLDEVDLDLLRLLQTDGRRSVAALARDVGLAESTCAGRVRALTERGIVRGFVADIDAASVGFAVEAMVAIRFSGHVRTQVEAFRDEVAKVPGVLALYNTSGGNDFLVHVAATGSDALRNFVLDHLANRPGVVHAETSLIFEATRGAGLLPAGRQP
ncbi:MAG TPA: Lrp/AsnC family transcriptional regulator [Phycicoccus elongatus]|jgi:DNA-binding Lrp family transcriptional regulator|uniref:Transcriptional regulator, AsnC family n=1 Tax=Phycicoccus elongatus Lp2 TaxID=1193181 RepID=N0E6D2_9MICO|nr:MULTISPECIES: Lrp/AsnC family transcriptional regulator [Phycicoccus]MBK8728138.1 Lrp/AsnC family transcriptional regulator [Tetrasphaera sp.]MCA0323422.1 Lrp/AsnC family transcriptional regulator [Actinomycetota bacterium]MCO5303655.1 Lrp/AsnC family transcriptional regulator [Phycicoccus sp.]CCH71339.1 Transcriptional regulator, AsnC family [Phycicoccus elongatus Lp2]HOA66850.1 Lrp/AsnC family transcriptional regulator [Phycicoccus elongatus]